MFTGEDLRAFDTLWGDGRATIVVENRYVNVRDSVVRRGESEIRADGLFSLGYPREDRRRADQRARPRRRAATSTACGTRSASTIYPVSGLLSGEFHLTGEYERPVGFGGDDDRRRRRLRRAVPARDRVAAGSTARGVRLDNLGARRKAPAG